MSHGLVCLQAQEFAKVMVPLFKQVAKCLNSSHFQVCYSHRRSPPRADSIEDDLQCARVLSRS